MSGMARLAPLSGFPEWTPQERVIERAVIDTVREVFALHGFAEIETRAVEPVERLAGESDAAKEIYVLRRLRAESEGDAALGLHFDLTVPFARYVEEHQATLAFPFRRYQVQKVWRGERPQEGRFREFYQADIDIVGRDSLPAHAEAEIAIVMARALSALGDVLGLPKALMSLNDRRLVEGFYRGVGIADVAAALRSVDKLSKAGPVAVRAELAAQGVAENAADAILALAQVRSSEAGFAEEVLRLWSDSGAEDSNDGDPEPRQLLAAGMEALTQLLTAVNEAVPGTAVADLSIARGLDYYTGAVYETTITGHEDLGSVCSGGRYDSLVAGGGFPGVGMSVGVSRLVSRIVNAGLATASRAVPSAVLVAVVDDDSRPASEAVANALRARGIACEVAPSAAKFGKQIQFADKRGIPFVWFPGETGDEVKDIRSGEQVPADASAWAPPVEDLRPRIVRG
jgi:histidyl-tRNA synthetase